MLNVECVVLTGGKSSRMGQEKAALNLAGESILDRTVRLLKDVGLPVTILGPEGMQDAVQFAGPLAALADFSPNTDWIFVASCDMPLFDARIVRLLLESANGFDAAVPSFEGSLQPLCAIYSIPAIKSARNLSRAGEKRIMNWVSALHLQEVSEERIRRENLDPNCVRNANTPDEWADLLRLSDKP